jgi:hypothetical protein
MVEDVARLVSLLCMRPAIDTEGTRKSNTTKESPSWASRSPSPARPALDRKVVHAEANVCKEDANSRAKQDIESVVPVVHPPRGGDEASRGCRHEREDHQQDWRSRATRTDGRTIIAKVMTLDRVLRQVREGDRELRSQPEGQVA